MDGSIQLYNVTDSLFEETEQLQTNSRALTCMLFRRSAEVELLVGTADNSVEFYQPYKKTDGLVHIIQEAQADVVVDIQWVGGDLNDDVCEMFVTTGFSKNGDLKVWARVDKDAMYAAVGKKINPAHEFGTRDYRDCWNCVYSIADAGGVDCLHARLRGMAHLGQLRGGHDGLQIITGKGKMLQVWEIARAKVEHLAVEKEGTETLTKLLKDGVEDEDKDIQILLSRGGGNREDDITSRTFSGHNGVVSCLDVSGDVVVTGSRDETVKVWNVGETTKDESEGLVASMITHGSGVACVKISENRQGDGEARLHEEVGLSIAMLDHVGKVSSLETVTEKGLFV